LAVDKTDLSEKPARARVLRAADVIPPFDKNGSQPGQGEPPEPMPAGADAAAGGANGRRAYGDKSTRGGVGRAERPPFDEAEIPTYDLAENILTEQRQVAARRRRRPGKTEDVPVASFVAPSIATGSKTFVSEPSSRDLLELQHVVAEIVARDIERLCRRPSRQPYAYP
jgi:hypothetical protein